MSYISLHCTIVERGYECIIIIIIQLTSELSARNEINIYNTTNINITRQSSYDGEIIL